MGAHFWLIVLNQKFKPANLKAKNHRAVQADLLLKTRNLYIKLKTRNKDEQNLYWNNFLGQTL